MITRKKLLSLASETRRRKLVRLLREWEEAASFPQSGSAGLDPIAAAELLSSLRTDPLTEETARLLEDVLTGLAQGFDAGKDEALPWKFNRLRGALLSGLGADPADWDFRLPGTRALDPEARTVLPIRLYLDGLRSPFNVGSIFRTAECFGAAEAILAPGTADPKHPRAVRSSRGSAEIVTYRYLRLEELPETETIFALESGGTGMEDFSFPPSGICILGNEELGISPEARKRSERSGGIVTIPLFGAKGSLNVSVAAGILLRAWTDAILRKDSRRSRNR